MAACAFLGFQGDGIVCVGQGEMPAPAMAQILDLEASLSAPLHQASRSRRTENIKTSLHLGTGSFQLCKNSLLLGRERGTSLVTSGRRKDTGISWGHKGLRQALEMAQRQMQMQEPSVPQDSFPPPPRSHTTGCDSYTCQ